LSDTDIIFHETFDNNKNDWPIASNDRLTTKIKKGYYLFLFEDSSDSGRIWKNVPIDSKSDFEIEMVFTKADGEENKAFGITWGGTDNQRSLLFDKYSLYSFYITDTGYFKYCKLEQGRYTDIIPWTESPHLKKGEDKNAVKIRKSGDNLVFYINNQLVSKAGFEEFFGNNIGFEINGEMEFEIEDIVVKGKRLTK
ncbi:hypothetical protein KKA14_02930, partial [bacterium]|nr:hypothetical protein [bacterium]